MASRGNVQVNLWRVGRRGEGRVKLLATTKEEKRRPIFAGWDRIVFRSSRSGSFEIWVAAKMDQNPPVSPNSAVVWATPVIPDGKNIAFDGYASPYDRMKNTNIFVVPSTANQLPLTDDKTLYVVPNWSRDGRWIYCIKQIGTHWETRKVPFEGGPQVQVSGIGMFDIVESDDGNLYYTTQRGGSGIWRRPVEGGQETIVPGTEKVGLFRYWQLSPTGIYFADGPTNPLVQFVNLKTGARTRLASLGPQLRKGPRGLAVSPDGSSFLYMQADEGQSDLSLIDNIP